MQMTVLLLSMVGVCEARNESVQWRGIGNTNYDLINLRKGVFISIDLINVVVETRVGHMSSY